MATIICQDCGDTASPTNPRRFHNLRPGGGKSLWVCEDCKGQRDHIDDSLGREPEPSLPHKTYAELESEAAFFHADLQMAKRRIAELEAEIRRLKGDQS